MVRVTVRVLCRAKIGSGVKVGFGSTATRKVCDTDWGCRVRDII